MVQVSGLQGTNVAVAIDGQRLGVISIDSKGHGSSTFVWSGSAGDHQLSANYTTTTCDGPVISLTMTV